jgi:ankyrin repeat protein
MNGDVAAITAALDAGAAINESDGRATPLYLAVRGGHFAAAKLLMERGADVNAAPTPLLGPALMPALAKRRIDLINLLLDGGANPNSQRGGDIVLHIAARTGCLDCVKALVRRGRECEDKARPDTDPSGKIQEATRSCRLPYVARRGLANASSDLDEVGFCRCRERPNLFHPRVCRLPQCRATEAKGRDQSGTGLMGRSRS